MDIFAIPHSANPVVSFASGVAASGPSGNQTSSTRTHARTTALSVLIFMEVK